MNKAGWLWAVLLLVGIGLLHPSVRLSADEDKGGIREKALELTKDQNSRIGKLITLQSFVRDEIAEVRTQYG